MLLENDDLNLIGLIYDHYEFPIHTSTSLSDDA